MSAVTALKHILLPAGVATCGVAQDVGLEQVIVGDRVPLDIADFASSIGRFTPHRRIIAKAQVGIGLYRCQEMASAFLQEERLTILLPVGIEIELRE